MFDKKEATAMAKYLILWEMDQSKIPINPKERGERFGALTELVKQDLKTGSLTDWGSFVGTNGGYAIGEGTEIELATYLQQYIPFVIFKSYPVMSVEQVGEILKALSK
jgi:hypothetical protein